MQKNETRRKRNFIQGYISKIYKIQSNSLYSLYNMQTIVKMAPKLNILLCNFFQSIHYCPLDLKNEVHISYMYILIVRTNILIFITLLPLSCKFEKLLQLSTMLLCTKVQWLQFSLDFTSRTWKRFQHTQNQLKKNNPRIS